MKNLYSFDILVNDVFYRSEHVLEYIKNHQPLTALDSEAIKNTILDALVDTNAIDPTKESLDLDSFAIVDNLAFKTYQSNPNCTSIPLSIKEAMRHHSLLITGGIPISLFYAKPAGAVSFCIYDMNTALSYLFTDFAFLDCDYDSPTREGVRALNRPFLEIEYHNDTYLVDALTKRIFKKSWFAKEYNMTINNYVPRKSFNKEQQEIYKEQTSEKNDLSIYINFYLPMQDFMTKFPKQAETTYEFDKCRLLYPESFTEAEKILKEMQSLKFF